MTGDPLDRLDGIVSEREELLDSFVTFKIADARALVQVARAARHLSDLSAAWRDHDNNPKFGPSASNSVRRAGLVSEYLDAALARLEGTPE